MEKSNLHVATCCVSASILSLIISSFSYAKSYSSYTDDYFSNDSNPYAYKKSFSSYESNPFHYRKSAYGYKQSPFSYRKNSLSYKKSSYGRNSLVFNPKAHTLSAINGQGNIVNTFRASGGKNFCPDIHRACRTPSGVFSVRSIGGPNCKSTRFPIGRGGAPMPYCMFYSKYYAIHGSPEVPSYNASHGCIRVTPRDAHWLSTNFVRVGTRVVVKSY